MAYGDNTFIHVDRHKIPHQIITLPNGSKSIFFDEATTQSFIDSNNAIFNNTGGYVIGNLHSKGGVQLLQKCEGGSFLAGEMEGHEYLVNPISTTKYSKLLSKIVEKYKLRGAPDSHLIKLPSNTPIIDVRRLGLQAIILDGDSYVLSRFATKEKIKLLNLINRNSIWVRLLK